MLMIVSAKQFQLNEDQIDRLYDIVIHAYAETEKEMWGEGYIRLHKNQFLQHIEDDEMLVALDKGKIVGGIRSFQLDSETWSFSLLATDFNEAGKGIGLALITEMQKQAAENGADKIKMEVLRPDHIKVESKERLKQWYVKLGYEIVENTELAELYPEKVEMLLVPSSFDTYVKELV